MLQFSALGNSRSLLPESKHEALAAVALAPSKHSCHGQCQQSQSTLFIIISGMCAMVFLLVIAIVLLCCSHFKYRMTAQRSQQASRESNGSIAPAAPTESSSCNNIVLVVLPGEKYPVICARPNPLTKVGIGVEFKRTSSDVKEENSMHIETPRCTDQQTT